jgi:hypothetical protein
MDCSKRQKQTGWINGICYTLSKIKIFYNIRLKQTMKALRKVKTTWSPELAYVIGLIATDGSLSNDGRHINFTSKDEELVKLVLNSLGLVNKIGRKARGYSDDKKYYVIQFGDVVFYRFLLKLGLFPNKSKTLGSLKIPKKYFFDFLRGHFDGDGTFYSYWDPRWKSSFMFYVELDSASHEHVVWLQKKITSLSGIMGRITKSKNTSIYRIKYAKAESLNLLDKMYYNRQVICLSRKRLKVEKALAIVDKKLP